MKEVEHRRQTFWQPIECSSCVFNSSPLSPLFSASAQVFHSKKGIYFTQWCFVPSRSLILWCICRQFSFSLQFSTKGQQQTTLRQKHEPRVLSLPDTQKYNYNPFCCFQEKSVSTFFFERSFLYFLLLVNCLHSVNQAGHNNKRNSHLTDFFPSKQAENLRGARANTMPSLEDN